VAAVVRRLLYLLMTAPDGTEPDESGRLRKSSQPVSPELLRIYESAKASAKNKAKSIAKSIAKSVTTNSNEPAVIPEPELKVNIKQEIANALGCSISTAGRHIKRAREGMGITVSKGHRPTEAEADAIIEWLKANPAKRKTPAKTPAEPAASPEYEEVRRQARNWFNTIKASVPARVLAGILAELEDELADEWLAADKELED